VCGELAMREGRLLLLYRTVHDLPVMPSGAFIPTEQPFGKAMKSRLVFLAVSIRPIQLTSAKVPGYLPPYEYRQVDTPIRGVAGATHERH
jgi:hypothetical protein